MELKEFDYGKAFTTAALTTAIGLGATIPFTNGGKQQAPQQATSQTSPVKPLDFKSFAQPEEKPAPPPVNSSVKFFADYISKHEGIKSKVYGDGRGNITIGIGHKITNESPEIFQKIFGNSVNFEEIKKGQALSQDQIYKLFSYDLKKHLDRAKRLFNHFDRYPTYLQAALLDSVYRGDTGKNTAALINQGKWKQAAKEYLDRYDYVNAEKLGVPGIRPRMERNRNAMLRYAEEK